MKIEFLSVAETELQEAVSYYNRERQGLEFEFASEIKKTLQRIVTHPEAWQPLSPCTKRCRTSRFPYGVIYQIRDKEILIVGVMHLKRNPVHWQSRVDDL